MKTNRLDEMAVFARVVEAAGFSAAARELGQSKSAVSKQIGRLEDRLGLRLLNRTTRRLSLTEAGRDFYGGCRRMLAEAAAAERAVAHLSGAVRGTLRVNAPLSFGVLHVAPALADFMRRHADLSVELVLGSAKELVMRLAGRICVRARRGRRRVAGPTQGFLDAALAQIRPVPKGSGQIGPLPRRSSSNMLNMSFLLAPNCGPIWPDQTHN